jgi:peptidoglycan/LPS O-acetylase OafA/YrhL
VAPKPDIADTEEMTLPQSRPADTAVASVPDDRPRRLVELDALRGVAAASVVLYHSSIPFSVMYDNTRGDGFTLANVLKYTPLHAIFAGYSAVIVFFVLSGLVLALPFVNGRGGGYRAFVVKRFFRLWPTYAAAIGLTFVLVAVAHAHTVSGMSSWFYEKWAPPVTAGVIAGHLSLIGAFDNNPYNPVIWSLVHEMRVSLAFPLIVAATMFLGWKRAIGLALLLSFLAVLLRSGDTLGNYTITLKYIPAFIAGILLAAHWKTLGDFVARISGRAAAALAAVALLAYTWADWADQNFFPGPIGELLRNRVSDVVVLTFGAALIIVLTQRQGRARSALMSRVPQFLGRISYSLYLVHVPVLLAVIHLLGSSVDPVLLLPLVWAISIGLADLSQRFIEVPSHALGRRLARHAAISPPDAGPPPLAVGEPAVVNRPSR